MEFSTVAQFEKRKKADVLVIPFWQEEAAKPKLAVDLKSLPEATKTLLATGDFKGREGECVILYSDSLIEKRMILLGLGKQTLTDVERLRRAYGSLSKYCMGKKLLTLNVLLPVIKGSKLESIVEGVTEGLLLPNYQYDRQKHIEGDENQTTTLIKQINWITPHKEAEEIAERLLVICDSVYYARDLINGNADDVTPQFLALCAKGLAKEFPKLKTTVFDKKRIEKEGMELLLAVNRGSALEPTFIIIEYKGNAKSKDHTVLVGKGITYDTGGLNIKTANMDTMKCDMSGAAACMGVMLALAQLKLPVNVTAVIPSTENCVDAFSYKPGDVYMSHAGKSVEMNNSDAEGRLILADALSYASSKLKPSRMIDLATLTGAIDICLGAEATGLMANNDELAEALCASGERTFERLWRMPLYEEYKDKLKSDIADIKNTGGRSASSSLAAIFLQTFVGENIPWAHLDIASTAFVTEAKRYLPKYGTGVGVRLLLDFLIHLKP